MVRYNRAFAPLSSPGTAEAGALSSPLCPGFSLSSCHLLTRLGFDPDTRGLTPLGCDPAGKVIIGRLGLIDQLQVAHLPVLRAGYPYRLRPAGILSEQ